MSAPIEIRVGSDSDLPKLASAFDTLDALGLAYETRILSAHRTPAEMAARARELEKAGVRVVIAAAGGSAHLPGMTSSETLVPVVGVPVETTQLRGLDSLYSILQMPEGVPTGCVGIGADATAALVAARIVGVGDSAVRKKLRVSGAPPAVKAAVGLIRAKGLQAGELDGREARSIAAGLGLELHEREATRPEELEGMVRDLEQAGCAAIVVWVDAPSVPLAATVSERTDLPVLAVPLVSGRMDERTTVEDNPLCRLLARGVVAGLGTNRVRNGMIFAAMIAGGPCREKLRAWRSRLYEDVRRKDAELVAGGVRAWLSKPR